MSDNFAKNIKKIVFGRSVEIYLSEGQQLRIRAYMDRVNQEQFKCDAWVGNDGQPPYDLDSEGDFLIAVDVLIGRGLAENEGRHGLFGTDWGQLIAAEQVDEAARRRRKEV